MGTAITKKKINSIQKTKPILLNKEKRKILISILPKIVDISKEQKLYEGYKETFKRLLTKEVREKFPEEEMRILEKYKLANEQVHCLVLTEGSNWRDKFDIEPTVIPYCHYGNDDIFDVSKDLEKMAKETIVMKKQIEVERQKRINSYTALINASKTIDDLKTVWLDVENVIAEHLKGDPVTKSKIQEIFSKEDAEVVIKDVKERVDNNESK